MKKKDLLVILVIVIIAAVLLILVNVINSNKINEIGVVHLGGKVILEFDISEDFVYEFDGEYGHMKLEVKDEKWRIFEEECPTHVCSSMGFVGVDDFLPIVCFPNNISVSTQER